VARLRGKYRAQDLSNLAICDDLLDGRDNWRLTSLKSNNGFLDSILVLQFEQLLRFREVLA
jgi:hypothetical protein